MSDLLKIEMVEGTVAKPFTEEYADRVQDMLELDFPDDLKEFLGNHNGGVPVKKYFRLGGNTKVLDGFLCLVENYREDEFFGQFDIGVVWSQIEERLSEFHLPFAAVAPGDFLCYDLAESDDGPIVLWVHDRSGIDKPFTVPVADDLKSLVGMLMNEESE